MAQSDTRPGRPVRLELNAQRVTAAMSFYQALFAWTSKPLHVPPWGSIPLIFNGDRNFGNQFMAMGAFAQPRWLIWFSADIERAESQLQAHGCDVGEGIYQLGDLGRLLDTSDPGGASFSMIEPAAEAPKTDQPGDPCFSELWGNAAADQAEFYADVLGLTAEIVETGAILKDEGKPRLSLRNTGFDVPVPFWLPYFQTTSVGGDCARAVRAGAVVQVHQEILSQVGELVVLSDPAGAYFGLLKPESG